VLALRRFVICTTRLVLFPCQISRIRFPAAGAADLYAFHGSLLGSSKRSLLSVGDRLLDLSIVDLLESFGTTRTVDQGNGVTKVIHASSRGRRWQSREGAGTTYSARLLLDEMSTYDHLHQQ
jgi:hypothetical protein